MFWIVIAIVLVNIGFFLWMSYSGLAMDVEQFVCSIIAWGLADATIMGALLGYIVFHTGGS